MVRFLASSALYLLANAVGLLVAALVVPGFTVRPIGFVVSVLFLSAVEIILGPFVLKMSLTYLPAVRGGVALVTTFIGLLLTSWLTDGLTITGLTAWLVAPFVVWVAVLLAAILLPMVLFKKILSDDRRGRRPATLV